MAATCSLRSGTARQKESRCSGPPLPHCRPSDPHRKVQLSSIRKELSFITTGRFRLLPRRRTPSKNNCSRNFLRFLVKKPFFPSVASGTLKYLSVRVPAGRDCSHHRGSRQGTCWRKEAPTLLGLGIPGGGVEGCGGVSGAASRHP